MKNLEFLLALHQVNGLGPIRLKKVLGYFKDPEAAWNATEKELKSIGIPLSAIQNLKDLKKQIEPEADYLRLSQEGIKVLTIFDENYPESLKQIYDPPIVLYYKGEILPADSRAIAVVGTRKITSYGKIVTEQLVSELASKGITIVSGLARGVDTTAHKAALTSQGRTLAVLGGGLNQMFPAENSPLADQISNGSGAVLSEFPPDYPALAGNFPARNRIVAGLSKAVLVTEAAEDSGSLITARLALEQGKDVFAVPGPITSNLSKGPSQLIQQGAALVTSAGEILDILGIPQISNNKFQISNELKNLSESEKAILTCLENEALHIDEICRSLKRPSYEISANLIKMEIAGLVLSLGGGNYIKT